jgi:hypothetical protein
LLAAQRAAQHPALHGASSAPPQRASPSAYAAHARRHTYFYGCRTGRRSEPSSLV